MTPQVAPWQVWWADFDPQVGREQAGRRPAIVVGTAYACSLPNQLVFVVPCTTKDRGLPFHPRIEGVAGRRDRRPSFVMCDQLKSISRLRLQTLTPRQLTTEEVNAVKFVLRQMIDTRPSPPVTNSP